MKVFLDMVGCRLNQSEIERYASQFRLAGHSLTSDPRQADLVVINTCTVTSAAASDSRQKIRQAARAGAQQLIITGCLATLEPGETASLPGVSRIIGNLQKDDLVPTVLNLSPAIFEHNTIQREPIPGARLRTRAFIKAQDGCDNFCTYCVTRQARGGGRSRSIKDILLDIQAALEGGTQEIVLTGVHLGSWGYDFAHPSHLQVLTREILASTDTPRLHLSSLEPWDISPDFFNLWQDHRLCRHLHLPLQSGCGQTLKRMGRKITPSAYAELIHEARRKIPDISITTDIITGFPGETEDEFRESADFVKAMCFSGAHVFTFSPRQGTPAAGMPSQIPFDVAKQRNSLMRIITKESADEFYSGYINRDAKVLMEKASSVDHHLWQLSGLSDNNLRIHAISPTPCRNQIVNVHITHFDGDNLLGEILQV